MARTRRAPTQAELRHKLEQHAANGFMNARTVLAIRLSEEAGLTRQMTVAEIEATMRADAVDPKAALNRRRALVGLPPL